MRKRLPLLILILLAGIYAQNILSCEHNLTAPKYYELIAPHAERPQQADFVFHVSGEGYTLGGKAILEFKLGENLRENERWFLVAIDQDVTVWRETYHGTKSNQIPFHGHFLVVAGKRKNSFFKDVYPLVSGNFGQSSVIGTPDGDGAIYDLVDVERAKEEAGLANDKFSEFWQALRNYLRDTNYQITSLPPLPQHLQIVDDQRKMTGEHIVRQEKSSLLDLLALSDGIPRKLEKSDIYYFFERSNKVVGSVYRRGDNGCYRYREHEPVANITGDVQQIDELLAPGSNSYEAKIAARALLENAQGFRRKAREIYHAQATSEQWADFLAQEQQAQKDLQQLVNNTDQEGTTLDDLKAFQLFKKVVESSVFNHLGPNDDLGSPALEVLAKVVKGGMPSRRLKGQGKKVSYLFVAYRRGKEIYPFAFHEKQQRILAHLQFLEAYAPGLISDGNFVKNYIRGGRIDLIFDDEGKVDDVIITQDQNLNGNGFFVPPGQQLKFDDQKEWLPLLKQYFQDLFNK